VKLLIAEDDLTSRTILAAVARKWGYEPIAVEDGEAAWEVLRRPEPPRLLLLDWMMPRLDGLALCRRIRREESSDPPFIILLTGRGETEDIVKALEAGANDHVAKPFENAELRARLDVGKRMLDLQEQLRRVTEALAIRATQDSLTGLLNRGAIMEALDQEMARAQRRQQTLCVGLCDIDHFKRVNDTHGHLAGDAVLREAARRIEAALRPFDHVGRYGGEEFLILVDATQDQAPALFERIRHVFADAPFVVEQAALDVTISCGATFFTPPADERIDTALIAAADAALYRAKDAGRNRTVFAQAAVEAISG
jgi:diguanylate cyclase (GGDEF)-like protein